MIGLALPSGPLEILCLAAHPDDIEIGCGGTLLEFGARPNAHFVFGTLTGSSARKKEAADAANAFAPGSKSYYWSLPDGRLPAHWGEAKQALEDLASRVEPDIILGPRRDDAHQDHRLLSELIPTVWRDSLVLEYEIPKWDGDIAAVSTYVAISDENANLKMNLLEKLYRSQADRDWWDRELFAGLMRVRGAQCRSRYAEGFETRKAVVIP